MNRPLKACPTHGLRVTLLAIVTALFSLGSILESARGQYTIDFVIDPYHPGIYDSWFFDINNQGEATGYVWQIVDERLTQDLLIYKNGEMRILSSGSPGNGWLGNTGMAINVVGDVVGTIDRELHHFSTGGAITPIQFPGVYTDLPQGSSGGLNDIGKALIYVSPLDFLDYTGGAGFGIWSASGTEFLTVLDPLYPYNPPPDPEDFNSGPSSGAYWSSITGLNNANQFATNIYSYYYDPGDPNDPENFEDDVYIEEFVNAYIYDGQGGYTFLESPSLEATINPIDIGEDGVVLGWVDDQSLALWGPDGALLSTLPDPGVVLRRTGRFGFPAVQRNNLGQVIAITEEAGGIVFYDPAAGAWTDITATITGLGTGTFGSIQGFNDIGQFVGLAVPPGNEFGIFAYVVSPVPEPSSFALIAISLPLAACRRRSSRGGQPITQL